MEALGTWRDLEALATGRRTTDLRPDEGTDGDGGSERDLTSVDGTTTTLLLDNNNLKEFVFSQLQLRALHTLSLSSNQLRCLDPGIASFAASLTVLKLECNALRSLPVATCELGRLEVLWLGCNELEELPARLGRLSRLRELCVDTNQLRTLPPSLGDLRRLETLSAETNMLRELPAAAQLVNDGACPLATATHRSGLANLKAQGAAYSPLYNCQAARRLDALRRVRLRHNRLAGVHAIEPLCHLRRLVELDLRGNSLLGALPERLGMLGELQVLRVPAAAALGALEPGHRACTASTAESGGARLPLLVALHRRHTRRTVAVQLRVAQGGRIRAWLWSPSAAPPMLHPPPASGVHLIVYDLAEFNKWSMNVGVGLFHTAIYLELLDIELNFAALPPCGSTPAAMRRLTPRSGVFVTPRGGAARWMPVRHRQSIALGQVRPHGQARRPGSGSGRAGHPRLEAPSRSRTAALRAPEQSYARLGPAVHAWGLSEAPLKSPISRPFDSPGPPHLCRDLRGAVAARAELRSGAVRPAPAQLQCLLCRRRACAARPRAARLRRPARRNGARRAGADRGGHMGGQAAPRGARRGRGARRRG